MDRKKCCGTCKWNRHKIISDDFECANSGSEYFADLTDFNDICSEWEEMDGLDLY